MKYLVHMLMLIAILVVLIYVGVNKKQIKYSRYTHQEDGFCSKEHCGIDPVSEPGYNMKQVIKQSLLLEDHLAFKNKRCIDCILKHFLLIIGYLEEAVWLACDEVGEYPLLSDLPEFYNKLMENWQTNVNDENNVQKILVELRAMRKKLVGIYYGSEIEREETVV